MNRLSELKNKVEASIDLFFKQESKKDIRELISESLSDNKIAQMLRFHSKLDKFIKSLISRL